jgi:three-Cys-motif partner protein
LDYLRHDYPDKQISIVNKDANTFIRDYCQSWPRGQRAVLFLDPFGLEVNWASIACIAGTKAIDLWLLFPLSSVMRMLPNASDISESWKQKLTRFFGEDAWYERFYANHQDVMGQLALFSPEKDTQKVKVADYQAITDYFVERLKTVFSTEGVVEMPMILYNSLKSPIFLLCFAASNPKGAAIAKRIAQGTIKG